MPARIRLARCVLAVLTLALPAVAQTAMTLEEELGQIDFPNPGAAEAQAAFRRGALLLHSFEYEDAAEAFRGAEAIGPDFALAYWGEALTFSHPIWGEDDPEAALEALARYGEDAEARYVRAETERERGLLAAVDILYADAEDRPRMKRNKAYSAAMRALNERYPDDLEIKSLYALSILGTSEHGRDERIYMRAASVAEEVYAANPEHPGALHYLIHSYDDPVHAPLGLRMARRYDVVAPAASHALHMPSHIYVALGMWDDSARANVASAAAADARRERKQLGVDARGFHALAWLAYTRLQQGQMQAARALLDDMVADAAESGETRARYYLIAMNAHDVLANRAWDREPRSVGLTDLGVAATSAFHFTRGMAAAMRGDLDAAKSERLALRTGVFDQFAEEAAEGMAAAPTDPGTGRRPDADTAPVASDPSACCFPVDASDALQPPGRRAAIVMDQLLDGLILYKQGETSQALSVLQDACADEDSMTFDFGPPVVVKPAHELFGDVLLELGRGTEAQAQYEAALQRAPRRALSMLGRAQAAAAAGDAKLARAIYAELDTMWSGADDDVRMRLSAATQKLAAR